MPPHTPPIAERVRQAADSIRRRWDTRPQVGIVFGTGLGSLADEIDADLAIDCADVPYFPSSTVPGHQGLLACGTLAGRPVLALHGRTHLYEGYSAQTITLPIRVMKELGCELVILSNASGGLRPHYATGDIVVIDDHINLMWTSPLIGRLEAASGIATLDMSRPYDPVLSERALAIARREGFTAHRGVYVGVTGPNYETRAEYRMLRRMGADVVGMSTVPEAIVAAQCGLRVLGLSTVTNVCRPDVPRKVLAEDVLHDAERAAPNVLKILLGVVGT